MENSIMAGSAGLGISPLIVMQILFSLMVSILFLQSGLDKVFNWKGEQDFYKSHFKDTILKNSIPILMPIITLSELAAGLFSAIGLLQLLFTGQSGLALLGCLWQPYPSSNCFWGSGSPRIMPGLLCWSLTFF